MRAQSEFIFRKVVSFDRSDVPPHGLVNVYDRETDQHIGQLHPAKGGGYLLRNRDGMNLAEFDSGRTPGFVGLSREPAARLLRVYVSKQDERLRARTGTVSEGCPNTWHNTADYRATTACPECPSAIGLRLAAQLLDHKAAVLENGGDDPEQARGYAEDIRDMIYVDPDTL
jgi:hypothetical protein